MTTTAGGPAARLLPGQPGCRFCGAALTAHQAVHGACADRHCEMRKVQEAARAVFQRNWNEYVRHQRAGIEKAAVEVAAAVRQLGEEPEKIAIGVVPRQNSPVAPLSEDRRASFAAHLDAIVAEALAAGEPELDLRPREVEEQIEDPLIGATCASCQGKCCILGNARQAFLTADTIQLHRQRNPGVTAAQISAHFLGRLPETHVRHSCVYHGPSGCVLPRRERADICNRYHCNPQTDLLRRFRAMSARKAIIVADEDDVAPAVGLYDVAHGWRPGSTVGGLSVPCPDAPPPETVARAVAAGLSQVPLDLPSEPDSLPPPPTACSWCRRPIDRHKAATTRCCGHPDCERRRIADIAVRVER